MNCNHCPRSPSPLHVEVCFLSFVPGNVLLEPWTWILKKNHLLSSRQRKESAVSSLIRVIHIQLFHKLVVRVMSATVIHVTVARIKERVFFNALFPLNGMCSRFFWCRVTLVHVSMWYIISLLITHYSPQQKWNSDPFACDNKEATAMRSRAQIPREQHFHKVYLGCHMQGQGLLTDMISLASGKGTHYPQTVWSYLHSFQTTLFVWCFKWLW